MIVELGHFAAILALLMAAGLTAVGFLGATNPAWRGLARSLALGQLALLAASFAVLVAAFIGNDFSVAYVARNSNSALPWHYRASAAWGAHEGSFLLWTLIAAGWTAAVSVAGRQLPGEVHSRALGVLGALNTAFLLFLLGASNPFERLLPAPPADGADLNPLLQDFGLIVHPPLLYTGYVGLAVAFAFAAAALLAGRLDAAWARWTRPWTNVAWAFLTCGIALGSWWAYYELGWGGWWFWDPVENASFMPWLAATALVHSLAVTEKRGAFKAWTAFLALAAFSLALLGAFIVRSGVLTSVHAFATDPERGVVLLIILAAAVGGAFALYALRAPGIGSRATYDGVSRELLLLANNAILTLALAVVLLGTLYPLAYEAATGGEKISVGPPYFNRVFVPLMLVLAACLAVAPISRWKYTPAKLFRQAGWLLLAALGIGVAAPLALAGELKAGAAAATALGAWLAAVQAADCWRRRGALTRSYLGMATAHLGFAVSLVGVAATSQFSSALDARLAVGESIQLNGVAYRFASLTDVAGPNYTAERGIFTTDAGDRLIAEKRRYAASGQVMTEAGIAPGFTRDRYVTLGDRLPDGTWAVRLNDKPLVRWVWLGALMMAGGGILAVTDPRYRRVRVRHRGGGATAAIPDAARTTG